MTDDKFKFHKKIDVPDEPTRDWTRNEYTGGKPTNNNRLTAEIITDRDLDKPIEQILCDIQETYVHWKNLTKSPDVPEEMKKPTQLILYALTRSASMNAVVALENRKTQDEMRAMTAKIKYLTWVLVALTVGILLLTGVMVALPFFKPSVVVCDHPQQNIQTRQTDTNINETRGKINNPAQSPGHIQKDIPSLGR